ncbi:MAG: hypothetical protein ACTHLH_03665 [Solirubrobacterales bacterium]
MKATMGDLVDAPLPRSLRVPLADRDQNQSRFALFFISSEDGTPPAGRRRDIELYATAETGSVSPFLFTAK